MKRFFADFWSCRHAVVIVSAWLFFILSIHYCFTPPNGKTARVVDICLGLAVGLFCYKGRIDYFSFTGWRLGVVLGAGLIGLDLWQFTMGLQPLDRFSAAHWLLLIATYILLAYNEEIWFRGLWFAQWPNRPIIQVLLGALCFGLAHIIDYFVQGVPLPVDGLDRFILASVGGVFFGIARYRGASLLMIAMPHALDDLNIMVIEPSTGHRFHHLATMLVANIPIYLILTAGLFWCSATPRKPNVS